jgi:adenylate cyclase
MMRVLPSEQTLKLKSGASDAPRSSMPQRLTRLFAALAGDDRHYTLEHRLFNTISLLNGATNIGGALSLLRFAHYKFLLLLHLSTGLLFLVFYYFARFRHTFRSLYWPFVLLTLSFVFVNALENAGTLGGAHYYLIPALLIAIILSDRARTTMFALALFTVATGTLLLVEQIRPTWIATYTSPHERVFDIASNLFFVQLFTGVLVMVLTQNLNQERSKSDRLLLNILPKTIAHELKLNDRVVPLDYERASVLFTDFVGFTRIAEHLTPQELIEELDQCFRQFDRIACQHKLEKIKTIGDSYMAVGGVPAANQTHAVDCVLAALEIQRLLNELMARNIAAGRPHWQLRVGINTGSIVAGVIGREKFAYDVWGDTVNTASRLESSGAANQINISQATYEQVQDFFVCEYRGKVTAKNKGAIDMYFVKGLRPELTQASNSHEPNKKFFELYDRLTHVLPQSDK